MWVRLGRSGVLAVLTGATSGAFGAYSYYNDLLRPLAHVFSIWIVLAVALSVRQTPRQAMFRTTVGLVAAVIAFYVGKKIMNLIGNSNQD